MDTLERHQMDFRDDMVAQLRRSDAALEDAVAALENLRRRIEALESNGTPLRR
jgi:hypothetical protein